MKEMKTQIDVKIYHVLRLIKSILLKLYYPWQSTDFSSIPVKLSMAFFTELEQNIFNLYGNTTDPK